MRSAVFVVLPAIMIPYYRELFQILSQYFLQIKMNRILWMKRIKQIYYSLLKPNINCIGNRFSFQTRRYQAGQTGKEQWQRRERARFISWHAGNQRDYQRFMILGTSRSGSNWMSSLLRSHPSILVYSEVFHKRGVLGPPFNGQTTVGLIRGRDEYPVRFLNDFIFRNYRKEIQAVGFKMFYGQLERLRSTELEQKLSGDQGLRIVHLKRRNLLRMLSSETIAERTGVWTNRLSDEKIYLSPDHCLSYFRMIVRMVSKYDRMFIGQQMLNVYYEDLVIDQDMCVKMLDFLDIDENTTELSSEYFKQEQRRLSEIIDNYYELKKQFANTLWIRFFD